MRQCCAIAVRGIVQGVGFRPFVYGLASRLDLTGYVQNQAGSVFIEVEGESRNLDHFLTELARHPPPLARIDQLSWQVHPARGAGPFRIEPSAGAGEAAVFVAPDAATCDDCLAELQDARNRRYRYPFLNCTNCGPRLTIVTGAPYDRERTTMAGFTMCAACQAEYDDPTNRRFHAQPTACPACGPHLELADAGGAAVETADPLAAFAAALRAGSIGAMKGLGGYHLACDARNRSAVIELRRRKHRDEKPFAVMLCDAEAAEAMCRVLPEERRLLTSPRRPIVLLRRRAGGGIADEVAPGNPYLGVMLPYTPLHHLLARATGGTPLVMTSGNRADEPIAHEDRDALERLRGIADVFLTHDRPIRVRCDDSVTRVVAGDELPVRRSRGDAPEPLELPIACPRPMLAVGGQLKATFALGRGRHAFISHHLGDLDHYDAYRAFLRDIALYEQLFAVEPRVLVHDLHPAYVSTRYAEQRAGDAARPGDGPALLAVQHHHAHMASCMAEHGLHEPVIGVAFDGTGYGTDGTIWGGEFLVGDYAGFRRAAHLRPVGMPGGDQAIREPWRMAAAHLLDAGVSPGALLPRCRRVAGDAGDAAASGPITASSLRVIERMLATGFRTPRTSSAGRLFDAVAAIAGVRERVSYEGQAAMELEWLATTVAPDAIYPFDTMESHAIASGGDGVSDPPTDLRVGGRAGPQAVPHRAAGGDGQADNEPAPLVIDTRPLVRAVAEDARRGIAAACIARAFHCTVVRIIATVCERIRAATGLNAVVLSGGVFLNALLTEETVAELNTARFRVYRHRRVPPNDGGLSFGQLAVAAAQLSGEGRAVSSHRTQACRMTPAMRGEDVSS